MTSRRKFPTTQGAKPSRQTQSTTPSRSSDFRSPSQVTHSWYRRWKPADPDRRRKPRDGLRKLLFSDRLLYEWPDRGVRTRNQSQLAGMANTFQPSPEHQDPFADDRRQFRRLSSRAIENQDRRV